MDEVSHMHDGSTLVFARQNQTQGLRLYLRNHHNGDWDLLYQRLAMTSLKTPKGRASFVMSERLLNLGPMRTKDALRVLDGAGRLFKLEHARETA